MKRYCLELSGAYACFTRPEMKVERVSYDIITPSAARACFEAILWKPQIRWHVRQIEILKPIQWITVRRNEISSVASTRNVMTAIKNGKGNLGLFIEDNRVQRAGLFLRDVAYRIHADMEFLEYREDPGVTAVKYHKMFERRARKGQCVHQPYLGCREFDANFRLVDDPATESVKSAPISETSDLGFMLYDLDFSDPTNPSPRFFRARMYNGVVNVPDWNSEEVTG